MGCLVSSAGADIAEEEGKGKADEQRNKSQKASDKELTARNTLPRTRQRRGLVWSAALATETMAKKEKTAKDKKSNLASSIMILVRH